MRLLADENIPGTTVHQLRDSGHDVLWIRESYPGMADNDIMELAVGEQRIIVTFDKDFGELAVTGKNQSPPGVILLRISKRSPKFIAETVEQVLGGRDDWAGHLAVIDDTHIRMRPLTGWRLP